MKYLFKLCMGKIVKNIIIHWPWWKISKLILQKYIFFFFGDFRCKLHSPYAITK